MRSEELPLLILLLLVRLTPKLQLLGWLIVDHAAAMRAIISTIISIIQPHFQIAIISIFVRVILISTANWLSAWTYCCCCHDRQGCLFVLPFAMPVIPSKDHHANKRDGGGQDDGL